MATDITAYLQTLGVGFTTTLVDLLIGTVLIAIGAIVAWVLGTITKYALDKMGVDAWLKKHKIEKGMIGFSVSGLAKLFVELIVFFAFAASASQMYYPLPGLTQLLYKAENVVCELLKFSVILFSGLLAAEDVSNRIKASKISFANFWGTLTEVFLALITLSIALNSLTFLNYNAIIERLITIIMWGVVGFVIAIGLGVGIAIGLGGKDIVKDILKKKKSYFENLI